ncbi:MAG: flippase [Candidatus Nanoarchaeia archaeon]
MEDTQKPLKTVAKGAVVFLLGMIFSKFFNYFFRIVTARLGTDNYGMITLAISFVSVLAVLATLGLNGGVLRYVPFFKSRDDEKKVRGVITFSLKISLIGGLLIGILLFVFSGFISRNFFPNANQAVFPFALKIVAATLPLTAVVFILFAAFEAFRFLKYEVYVKNIFDGAFKLALTFVVVYVGFGVLGVMFVYLASMLGSMILSFYYLNKFFKIKGEKDYVNRELLVYSLPLVLSGLCIIMISSVDSWIIGYFRNASEVGIYNAAMPTAQILLLIPSIILILFLPVLAELYSKRDKHSFNVVYKSATKWVFLVNLPIAVLFVLFSDFIITFLFGKDYAFAGLPFTILSVGFFASSIFATSEKVLMVVKRTRFILFSYLIVLLVNALLNIYLVPKYSIKGAAIASASSYILLSILFLFGSCRFARTIPFTFDYLKAFFAVLVSFFFIYLLNRFLAYNSIYFTLLLMALFGLSYLGLLFLLKCFDREDLMILKSIRNKLDSMVLSRLK